MFFLKDPDYSWNKNLVSIILLATIFFALILVSGSVFSGRQGTLFLLSASGILSSDDFQGGALLYSLYSIDGHVAQSTYAQGLENSTADQSGSGAKETAQAVPNGDDGTEGVGDNRDIEVNKAAPEQTGAEEAAGPQSPLSIQDRDPPDDDCLFNPSLEKCASIDGGCPNGFLMNEDGNCFPNKPCPLGYTKIDDDETGTCHPTGGGGDNDRDDGDNIVKPKEITKTIINKIIREEQNNQVIHAASATCPPITQTLPLSGQMEPNGIRIVAFTDPCVLSSGSVMLNIPKNLKLIAGHFDDKVTQVTAIPMQNIQQLSPNQWLFRAQVEGLMNGLDPVSNNNSSVSNTNTLILWNDNNQQNLTFSPDSSVSVSLTLRQ